MSDPTLTTLERVLHSGDYVRVAGIPVFDVHEERRTDPRTKKPVVVKFDRARLQAIADRCNRRAEETGDLSPIGPGHTVDDQYGPDGELVWKAKESDQPEIWGFAHNWRVGKFGPKGKLALVPDQYIRKDKVGESKTYPRRSVELWLKDGFIDWIALLRRTPQRDLGLVAYGKDDPRGAKLRYSMGDAEMEPLDEKPEGDLDPTGVNPDPDISPEEHEKFKKCAKAAYPHLDAMHSKYAADQAPPAAPAMPGATDAALPAAPPGDDPMRMRKVQDSVEKASYDKRLHDMEQRLAARDREAQLARYERDLTGLLHQYDFDLAEEMGLCGAMDQAAFDAHKARIVRRYHRRDDPTVDPNWLPGGAREADLPGHAADDAVRTEAESERYADYYRKNPDGSREEALKYAKKRA